MSKRWLVFVVGVTACASTEVLRDDGSPDEPRVVPDAASGEDGGADALPAGNDAAPCADCEYFPATCTPDAFCLNGPFDPNAPGGSIDLRSQFNVIRGRSPNDVWVAGALGALAHFDGTSWTRSDPGVRVTMRALWLRDSAEVSFGAVEQVFARGLDVVDAGSEPSAGGWTVHRSLTPPMFRSNDMQLASAWAAPGAESLWVAARAWRTGWTTGLWRLRLLPSSKFEVSYGVPPQVCVTLPCSELTSIHGASANELWAVGLTGATIRITDAESDTPTLEAFNSQTWDALHGVWAASASEAWSVGALGTIRHYTGHSLLWDIVADVPTNEDLNGVWGSSPSDVWAVGNAGVVLHFDGKSWSRVKVAGLGARRPNLTAVWVAAPGHVWIAGQGVILSLGGKP
jgi:hypothetical protein